MCLCVYVSVCTQVAQLRADLDARLATAADAGPSAAGGAAADARYGAEVWSRCEALTAGLAGELAEQLRLILEPTLASRLAGEYRTGVLWIDTHTHTHTHTNTR